MEAVQRTLNEANPIEPMEYKNSSPPSDLQVGCEDVQSSNSVQEHKVDEADQPPMTDSVPSDGEIISEDKEIQEGVHHLVDNEDLKLDLPDNLGSEDFSKLLGFDEKQDDDLFATQAILEKAIRDTDSQQHENEDIEKLASSIEHDVELSQSSTDETEIKMEIKESHSNDNGDVDNVPRPTSSDQNKYSLKEETLSPRRTFSDLDNNIASLRNGGSHTGENDNDPSKNGDGNGDSADVLENSVISESDRRTPAAILHEKGNLMYSKRHDSLTPMIFQQHEFKQLNGTELNSNTGKEGVNNESPALPEEQPTISAYARLDFQSFTFYVQTLHVIIGRRSENDFSHKVDVNLGPSKSISRRHAQIFYNFGTGRFELSIIGKNGAFVDDIFVERGNTVPLKNRTKIQIGQIPFQFALPEHEKSEKELRSPEQPPSIGPQDLESNPSKIKTEEEKKTKAPSPSPKKLSKKTPVKKEKKPAKVPKKVYTLEEIPIDYRTKPTYSYSALLTTCIRKYSSAKGMSLSEIYAGIRELFPYYKYCPDGWQSSVRHNLSLNKSFRKVSKEGKGWLWGLDEQYIAERELLKKKQAETAAAKAHAAQQRLEQQQQQQRAKKALTSNNPGSVNRDKPLPKNNGKQQNISQTLAANRSADKKPNMDDHQRTMKYLQEQLMILTRDRKGLSKQVIASILTQALAMTINQVTQAARNKGITGNPLTALMDKNPQHLNLILAAAVNAATSKVTNGEVKQLVNLPQPNEIPKQVKKPANATANSKLTSLSNSNTAGAGVGVATRVPESNNSGGSFDPTSLSRFFQPRQPARAPLPAAKPTIPQKRSHANDDEETSSSEESSGSEDDDSGDSTTSSEDENKDDGGDEDDDGSSAESSGESESGSDTENNVEANAVS